MLISEVPYAALCFSACHAHADRRDRREHAGATPETVRIRGTIASFDGSVLTVTGAASTYKVTLPDNARVSWVVKSDLSKIGPNSYVGTLVVAQPDGSLRATEVSIFPETCAASAKVPGRGIRCPTAS